MPQVPILEPKEVSLFPFSLSINVISQTSYPVTTGSSQLIPSQLMSKEKRVSFPESGSKIPWRTLVDPVCVTGYP